MSIKEEAVGKVISLWELKGTTNKKNFIKENADDICFKKLLWYALNPRITYKISEETLRSGEGIKESKLDKFLPDIFILCARLSEQKALNKYWIDGACSFVNRFDGKEKEFYIKLLSKTLRLGVTGATVNKIIPECIPEWEIQQAFPIDKYPLNPDTEFTLTQKLNGVRATYYKGELYARSGVPYKGLEHITKVFDVYDDGVVFDGELTLKDKGALSDNEAFRKSTGIINSDNVNKTGICYTVFDALPVDDFEKGESKATYETRRSFLNSVSEYLKTGSNGSVTVLPVLYHGKDQSMIPVLLDKMVREDKEGLMVNLDVPYKCKRHRGILKVKRFYTLDLPILRCEEGSGRLEGTLGAFVLDYKGNEVNVGTGFSDEQRSDFWEQREDLVGVLCEVKYKEISYDKSTGAESLQFPVFISLRTDKNEVSYG